MIGISVPAQREADSRRCSQPNRTSTPSGSGMSTRADSSSPWAARRPRSASRAGQVDGTRSDDVARWADGLRIVFNATAPVCNLPTMHGCLQAGAHYLDMNSGPFEIRGVIPANRRSTRSLSSAKRSRPLDSPLSPAAGSHPAGST